MLLMEFRVITRVFLPHSSDSSAADLSAHHVGHIQNLCGAQIVAEIGEVLERPNDFFGLVVGHFNELGIFRPGVGVADDDISVGQIVQAW